MTAVGESGDTNQFAEFITKNIFHVNECQSFYLQGGAMKSGPDHLNDRADQGSARIHLLVARHCLKKVFIRHTYSSSIVILSLVNQISFAETLLTAHLNTISCVHGAKNGNQH